MAFSYAEVELKPGEQYTLYGLFGHVPQEEVLKKFLPEVGPNYYEKHWEINRSLIGEIRDYAFTSSGFTNFDNYMGYSFLDNIIRGGIPTTLAGVTPKIPRFFGYIPGSTGSGAGL